MLKKSRSEETKRDREGLTSYVLLKKGDIPSDAMSITWVDVDPNSDKDSHAHDAEQVYVIVKGNGKVKVGQEEQQVSAGDLVYIPANEEHKVENSSTEVLSYIAASTPAAI